MSSKLTPIQRHILAFASDDGVASLLDLMASMVASHPVRPPSDQLLVVGGALVKLHRLGCLYLARQRDGEQITLLADEWKHFSLGDLVVWDDDSSRWIVNPVQPGVTDIVLQLSIGGANALSLSNRTSVKADAVDPQTSIKRT